MLVLEFQHQECPFTESVNKNRQQEKAELLASNGTAKRKGSLCRLFQNEAIACSKLGASSFRMHCLKVLPGKLRGQEGTRALWVHLRFDLCRRLVLKCMWKLSPASWERCSIRSCRNHKQQAMQSHRDAKRDAKPKHLYLYLHYT